MCEIRLFSRPFMRDREFPRQSDYIRFQSLAFIAVLDFHNQFAMFGDVVEQFARFEVSQLNAVIIQESETFDLANPLFLK